MISGKIQTFFIFTNINNLLCPIPTPFKSMRLHSKFFSTVLWSKNVNKIKVRAFGTYGKKFWGENLRPISFSKPPITLLVKSSLPPFIPQVIFHFPFFYLSLVSQRKPNLIVAKKSWRQSKQVVTVVSLVVMRATKRSAKLVLERRRRKVQQLYVQ